MTVHGDGGGAPQPPMSTPPPPVVHDVTELVVEGPAVERHHVGSSYELVQTTSPAGDVAWTVVIQKRPVEKPEPMKHETARAIAVTCTASLWTAFRGTQVVHSETVPRNRFFPQDGTVRPPWPGQQGSRRWSGFSRADPRVDRHRRVAVAGGAHGLRWCRRQRRRVGPQGQRTMMRPAAPGRR